MADTFEEYVDEWLALKRQIDAIAGIKAQEMAMRKEISAAVERHLGDDWKEGANSMTMADGRKLTVTNKIDRKVDETQIAAVRERYNQLNDRPIDFDDLLRVKYEVAIAKFRELEGEAANVFADLITTKPASPEVKVK